MAILLTGGTGKTAIRLGSLLQSSNIPFLLTSRRGASASSFPTVKFDWKDSSTWKTPFTYSFPNNERISAVYLLAGDLAEPADVMNPFIDMAREKYGVKRFVLCSGSTAEPGGAYHGKVWQHMIDTSVEYCVLRPSWFMENLSEPGHGHYETIKHQSKIYSACADGKIPFISAGDIAAVAYKALTNDKLHETSYRILGPELLTYDQVAEKLSKTLGREIQHVNLDPEQRTQGFVAHGLPEHFAGFLTWLETTAAKGGEERMGDDVETVTGRKPVSFDEFAERNKQVWG